jgi:hypothetical protein
MVEVEFDTRCAASLRETWRAKVPAGLGEDELREYLDDALTAGRCTFVEEEAYDEHDREITEVLGEVEPEPGGNAQLVA